MFNDAVVIFIPFIPTPTSGQTTGNRPVENWSYRCLQYHPWHDPSSRTLLDTIRMQVCIFSLLAKPPPTKDEEDETLNPLSRR